MTVPNAAPHTVPCPCGFKPTIPTLSFTGSRNRRLRAATASTALHPLCNTMNDVIRQRRLLGPD